MRFSFLSATSPVSAIAVARSGANRELRPPAPKRPAPRLHVDSGMLVRRGMRFAAMGAAMVGLLAAVAIHYRGPDPSADVARGSDDAFARGLFPRELLERQGPMRWTRERA